MIHDRFFMHAEQWYARHDDIVVVIAEPDDGPKLALDPELEVPIHEALNLGLVEGPRTAI